MGGLSFFGERCLLSYRNREQEDDGVVCWCFVRKGEDGRESSQFWKLREMGKPEGKEKERDFGGKTATKLFLFEFTLIVQNRRRTRPD